MYGTQRGDCLTAREAEGSAGAVLGELVITGMPSGWRALSQPHGLRVFVPQGFT